MELWLLGAGALVLVGIAVWIFWPAPRADRVGASVAPKEVVEKPMTNSTTSGMPPQGDRFDDQYTSATADLSAGGVAATLESMHESPTATTEQTPSTPPPFAAGTYGGAPYQTPANPAAQVEPESSSPLIRPRSMGLGAAGALLALGGGAGGAWLYARWQRERNKPINRLRRGARDVASRLGDRMPELDELPRGAAPMSGAATALLLTALVATRALRRDSDDPMDRGRATMDRGRDALKLGRERSRQLQAYLPADRMPSVDEARKPAVMGIGFGGIALISGSVYMIWRLARRGRSERTTWYTGE